ncbi:hypothetical protein [Pseudomonas fluorescens]|uniref:hypothetical protein n=1 Tax=Pseudomonas fluorescens TaxID=294 RepID=UPI0017876CC5|nr:hypothetical protein [Pseudomonas fluorescens]
MEAHEATRKDGRRATSEPAPERSSKKERLRALKINRRSNPVAGNLAMREKISSDAVVLHDFCAGAGHPAV